MIDNTQLANQTTPMNDETEIDVEAVQDALFHVELSDCVSSLPPMTVEQQTAYDVKMQLLNDIRNEVFPPAPAPEWDHNETYDSKYHHEYSIGSR